MSSAVTAVRHAPRYLAIYLNDHLAGSLGGIELAKRMARRHAGTPLGAVLATVASEIEADRRVLADLMAAVGVEPQRLKLAVAWLAEKASRLKLNGELLKHSPLSTFVELETLAIGINGKLLLWRALEAADGPEPPGDMSLAELIARAEEQLATVEEQRLEAARRALRAEG